jgi:hypothetical protein
MNRKELAHWRMRTQRLWTAPLARPAEVVRWFGAMQAQEFVPAKWAIAQRCGRTDDDQIERLYATGEILRTHLIRPTWHFVHRDDIRWVIEATKYRVHQINGTYYRQCGVDDDTFKRCAKAFTKALKGGNELNRRELVEVLKKGAGIEAAGLRMGYLLMRAELDAVIVSGSVGGKQPTFACFDERVPEKVAVSHDEAVAALTLRYFRSRGPTTLKDFIRWSSLTVAEAKAGLSSVRSELRQRDIDGRTYFFVKAASGQPPSSPRIDLIQGYDEYVMSYSDSKDVLRSSDGRATSRAINPNVYLHAVLLDGQLIGHWKYVRRAEEITVETALYRKLGKAETSAMDVAVKRFGDCFGIDSRWTMPAHLTQRTRRIV